MIEKSSKTKVHRKVFSILTKQKILIRQNFCCNECGKYSELLQFHHKNGNRADNRLENCEALCPNCHAKKTRLERMLKKRRFHKGTGFRYEKMG